MKIAIFTTLFCLAAAAGHAKDDERTLGAVYSPEIYDSLLHLRNADIVVSSFDAFFNDFIDVEGDSTLSLSDALPDSVYAARLKMLLSPIELPYNEIVKKYIVAYTLRHKESMRNILGRSQYYFPIFENELVRTGLPVELRMLPVVESALSPSVTSRAGARGLWQFIPSTGKVYGLDINSFVDQRCDPVASTAAACRFLKSLYNLYGDWTLALAAYNCGPGNVNKALKRAGAGAKTFWDIYEYLPRETRGYVPSFVAATYAYTFHKQHQIEPYPAPVPLSVDTVMVTRLMHLEQVSSSLGVPIETLRLINPQYRLDIIPALDRPYTLVLPSSEVSKYIDREAEILSKDSTYLAQYLKPGGGTAAVKARLETASTVHRVKSGENLGSIARKYGVTVSQIMRWNNLRNANRLSVGQRLEINK